MDDPWLKVEQVAERLGLHADTVRRFLRSGRMRGHLISRKGGWRVRGSDVDRFVVESSVTTPPTAGAEPSAADEG